MTVTSDGLTQETREATRRTFLGKASLVVGAAGVAALARAEPAHAVPPTLGAFYNVRDYLTGVDRAAIQAAIDDAFVHGGGIVWFPPGTYNVDDWVLCKEGVSLRGAGSGSSVIKAADSNPRQVLLGTIGIGGSEVANVTVEDLVIDGNRTGRPSATAGAITFAGLTDTAIGDNIHIRRCEIRESPGIGCQFVNVRNSSVVDCWIHGCGNTENGGDGIDCFYNCEDILYEGNLIEDTTDEAIGLNAEGFDGTERHGEGPHQLRRVKITGNILAAGSAANSCVGISGAEHVVVDGNILWQGQAVGVGVRNFFDTPARDVVVSNNVFIESGIASGTGNAVNVNGAAGSVYDDWGSTGCERVSITGNVIVNPRQAGIRLVASPATPNGPPSAQKPGSLTDIFIQNNVIAYEPGATTEASANGLQSVLATAQISNLVVQGNTIRAAKGQGILLMGANHKNAAIVGNRVFDSGTGATYNPSGIDITDVEGVVVKDNICARYARGGRRQDARLWMASYKPHRKR